MNIVNIGQVYRDDTTVGRAMNFVPRSFFDVKFVLDNKNYEAKIRLSGGENLLYECRDENKNIVNVSKETEELILKNIKEKEKKTI